MKIEEGGLAIEGLPRATLSVADGCFAGANAIVIEPIRQEGEIPEREMMGEAKTHYEVIVVGAGVAGIYQIKRLVDLGIDATVLDSAPDLGGTWYWNRYPGCRFDSESYTYGFSFSRELLDEWHWKERFSGQHADLPFRGSRDRPALRADYAATGRRRRLQGSLVSYILLAA
jgi:putative NAD(P)-binding protein